MKEKLYHYRCTVERVVDGDTIDLVLDLGFKVSIRERVRLYGINTPETRTRDKVEKAAGLKAKAFVIGWLDHAGDLIVITRKDKRGKFGRVLAEIIEADGGLTLNQELVARGLAVPYFGGKR